LRCAARAPVPFRRPCSPISASPFPLGLSARPTNSSRSGAGLLFLNAPHLHSSSVRQGRRRGSPLTDADHRGRIESTCPPCELPLSHIIREYLVMRYLSAGDGRKHLHESDPLPLKLTSGAEPKGEAASGKIRFRADQRNTDHSADQVQNAHARHHMS